VRFDYVGSYPDGERTAVDVGEIRRREMGGEKGVVDRETEGVINHLKLLQSAPALTMTLQKT
jgi:hypothetical protein